MHVILHYTAPSTFKTVWWFSFMMRVPGCSWGLFCWRTWHNRDFFKMFSIISLWVGPQNFKGTCSAGSPFSASCNSSISPVSRSSNCSPSCSGCRAKEVNFCDCLCVLPVSLSWVSATNGFKRSNVQPEHQDGHVQFSAS